MQQIILAALDDAERALDFVKKPDSLRFIQETALLIAESFKKGGKLLIAGNGGSLCDAMHFAEELTGIFRKVRPALPAIALSDPGHLSCMANDVGYENVFARGVEALGRQGDVFAALTTSGNSKNLLLAVPRAKELGLKTVSFLGKTGGALKGQSDLEWIVDGFIYSDRIQEAHMMAIHIIIELIEKELFHGH